MTQIAEPIHLDERKLVQLAVKGDTGAFEELCRRHAPAVWRFSHAVVANPATPQPPVEAVREATVDGMARALVTLERTPPTAVAPYRAQTLSTILAHASTETPATAGDPAARVSATLAAFATLPLQWRAVIWLSDVEGLSQRAASSALGLDPDAVDQLAVRARAGFGSRRSVRSLRSMVHPMPTDLVDQAWQRWQTLRTVPRGPFGLVVGGHRTPAWMERAVAGAAASVIALGITGAVVFGGSPDGADRLRPAGIATEQLISSGFEEVALGKPGAAASVAPSLQSLSTLDLGTTPDLDQLDLPPLGRLDLTPSAPVAKLRQSDIGAVSAAPPVAADPGVATPTESDTDGTTPPTTAAPTDPGTTTPPATDPPTTTPPTQPPTTPPTTEKPTIPDTTLPIIGGVDDILGTGGDQDDEPRLDVEVDDTIDVQVSEDCVDLDVLDTDLLDEECGTTGDGISADGELLPTLEVN